MVGQEWNYLEKHDLLIANVFSLWHWAVATSKCLWKSLKTYPQYFNLFFFYLFRRAANLPEVIVDAVFGDRPMTPVLREAQQLVLPSLSQCYCEFHEVFDIIINLFECVVVPYFNNKLLYEESFDTCTGSQFMQVLFSLYKYIYISSSKLLC